MNQILEMVINITFNMINSISIIYIQRVIAAENPTACKGYRSTRNTGECKSNDGLMNQEYPHSVLGPIGEHQRPGDIPSKPRIYWPKGNQIATWTNLDPELYFCSPPILRAPLINK